jgi:hypothetical protein
MNDFRVTSGLMPVYFIIDMLLLVYVGNKADLCLIKPPVIKVCEQVKA